jgi:predicted nucleotidyltransferase component of viral defense system
VPDPLHTPPGLTPFQVQLAQLFFSLPESAGFLLAGGAALAAQHLTTRPTQDLDFFTGPDRGNIPKASVAFEAKVSARGWSIRRVRDGLTFCRMVVSGSQDVLVDLALDSPPTHAAVPSVAGPTFALEELAGRKVIALFDRAEARDFADVYALARRYDKDILLAQASEIDAGFDLAIFAEMLRTLARFTDDELPIDPTEAQPLRTFFASWAADLQP